MSASVAAAQVVGAVHMAMLGAAVRHFGKPSSTCQLHHCCAENGLHFEIVLHVEKKELAHLAVALVVAPAAQDVWMDLRTMDADDDAAEAGSAQALGKEHEVAVEAAAEAAEDVADDDLGR